MSEQATEIYRLHVESHSRFVYFLLGIAAASIAFAVHETRGQALALIHVPIGVAVACWAASFAAGTSGLARRQNVLRGNSELLKLLQGLVPPPVAGAPVDLAASALREVIEAESAVVARRWRWQQWLLFTGVVAYLVGHVMGMATIPGD
jgi:hypothetical protein